MKKILVVEDRDEHRGFIRDILQNKGYQVFEASNGKIAIEILRDPANDIDLVTLDYSMPEMDGLECLKQIRRDETIKENRKNNGKYHDIPVIVITVFITADEVKEMKKMANDFLPKPLLSYKDILKTVEKVLKNKSI